MSWILSFDANAENKKNNYRNDMPCSLFMLTAEGLLGKQILKYTCIRDCVGENKIHSGWYPLIYFTLNRYESLKG